MNTATSRTVDLDRVLSTGEAARQLGVSVTWIKTWIQRGELVGHKTSLGWLVDSDSIDALAAKRAEIERVS